MFIPPEWWTTIVSIITEVWNLTMMIADILQTVLLIVTIVLTVFVRIAVWVPGEQPEKFLISVRDYLSKFIDKIALISRKKR